MTDDGVSFLITMHDTGSRGGTIQNEVEGGLVNLTLIVLKLAVV